MKSATVIRSEEDSNFHHLVMDIAWFGLGLAASTRFLSVYAIRLGATPIELGWLASLPAIVLLLSSALGVWWRRRYPDSIHAIIWPSLGFRFSFLLPAFAPFFPPEWQPAWLILSVTLPAIPQGISGVIFLTMLREAVNDRRLTALLSRRSVAMNIAVAIGVLAFGFWLERVAFPLNYQVMFVVAFLATLVSLWHLSQVHTFPQSMVDPDKQHPTIPRIPWRSSGFRRVAFVTVITHVAFFSIFPLTPLYLVQELGASEGFMALFGLAELAAAAGVSLFTSRIVQRIGNRNMMALSMLGTALGTINIALAPDLYTTLVAAILIGASWTAVGIGLFGFFTENTPADDAPRYTTAYFQLISLSTFIGPMIGSYLAQTRVDLVWVLLLGAVLRLMAAALVVHDTPARYAFPRWLRAAK